MTGGINLVGNQGSAWNAKGLVFTNGSRIGESTALGIYSAAQLYLRPNAGSATNSEGVEINTSGLIPSSNNTETLGDSSHKWANVYATTFNGALNGNASTATTLQTARTIDGVSFNGSANIIHYGTCSTAAGTAAKTVAITGFTLTTGAVAYVKFSNTNTAATPTLNINSTGAKNIYDQHGVQITASYGHYLIAGKIYTFMYDGTNYVIINVPKTLELYERRTITTTLNKAKGYGGMGNMFHLLANTNTSATDNGKPPLGDANVLQMNWDNTTGDYDSQLAISTASNRMEFRSAASSKKAWREVVTITPDTAVGNTVEPVYVASDGIVTIAKEMIPVQRAAADLTATTPATGAYYFDGATNPVTNSIEYGTILTLPWRASGTADYSSQLLISSAAGTEGAHMYIRRNTSTPALGTWSTILDNNNYTTYTVTKTGGGASGSWGISITGSAGSVAWANVTGKPSTFSPSSHTHYELATIGDQRSTATTPNTYVNRFIFQGLKTNSAFGSPSSDSYSYVLGLRGWSDSSGGNSHELAFNNTGIYHRDGATTTWNSWHKLVQTGSNTLSEKLILNFPDTSSIYSQGALQINNTTASKEATIGYGSNGSMTWTVGVGPGNIGTSFGWWYSNVGNKMTLTKDGALSVTDSITAGARVTSTSPSSEVSINRITITPYFHTGGPWYIKSMDDSSNAHLALYYGSTQLLKIKHDGTFIDTLKASITGNAATATKLSNTPNTTTTYLRGDNSWQTLISSGTSTLAWNSEVTLATVGGTAIKAKLPANPNTNTDTLVKQTLKSDNVEYKILTTTSASPSSGSTAEAAYGADMTINPSAKTITSPNFKVTSNATITYNTANGCLEIIV